MDPAKDSEPVLPPAGARVGVVIPALNEERALAPVLAELWPALDSLAEATGRGALVVVVDNGSTDATAEVARQGGALVVAEPRRGYGQACLAGLAELDRHGFEDGDWVVFLDADHSDHPADLVDVAAPLVEDRADFVIGSRVLGGATMEALLPQAWFGNRLACGLMRLLFGARYSDLGPFRALTMGALRHLAMHDTNFGWTIEMQLKAHMARLRVVEVPVRYRARIGTSKITGTLRGTLGAGSKILGWIFGWRLKTLFTRGGIPKYR